MSIIFISSVCLSIFFSVHYLVIYYLLQPYNAATEVKSPAYSAIKGLTYVVCYMMLQIDISSLMFGIGTMYFALLTASSDVCWCTSLHLRRSILKIKI